MNKTERQQAMYERIRRHGENLKTAFGLPTETDPVKLCKSLRRIELRAHKRAEDVCNGLLDDEDELDRLDSRDRRAVQKLLGTSCPLVINHDPRGYALKLDSGTINGVRIYADWGGHGILAPDLTGISIH